MEVSWEGIDMILTLTLSKILQNLAHLEKQFMNKIK
jgi:hypothetical protein